MTMGAARVPSVRSPPTIQSTPTNVTAVTAALKMPTTKSTGASVAIRASSPMRPSGF
jgi:hypothetical protein